ATALTRVILSTDDEEIAAVGRELGVEVPFLRPHELARDDTPTLPVIRHAVAELEREGTRYDAVCILQPTSPFRRPEWIDACVKLLFERGADCVITVAPVPSEYNPHWVYFEDPQGFLVLATGEGEPIPRRQDLPQAYHRDGSVYVTRRDVLMKTGSLYGRRVLGYLVDAHDTVNIDTVDDLAKAASRLGARRVGG
ncbi:MAG: cytidylyltransferase domain-containing protein, partial [Chloroflexia bacterium]